MQNDKEILSQIKSAIQEIIPDAKVYLFGSRARGDWNEESDWDILVLTNAPVNRKLKKQIHNKLFPLSLAINSLFQFVVVTEEEWGTAPHLYALHKLASKDLVSL